MTALVPFGADVPKSGSSSRSSSRESTKTREELFGSSASGEVVAAPSRSSWTVRLHDFDSCHCCQRTSPAGYHPIETPALPNLDRCADRFCVRPKKTTGAALMTALGVAGLVAKLHFHVWAQPVALHAVTLVTATALTTVGTLALVSFIPYWWCNYKKPISSASCCNSV